jgi:integrase
MMPSSWIIARSAKDGGKRYRVLFRVGGRESKHSYAGSFRTKTEALARKRYVDGELAGLRAPDVRALNRKPERAPTLLAAYERWQASRVDVSEATATYQRSPIRRARPLLARPVDEVTAADIAELIGALAAAGKSRETIRKTVTVVAMVFDYAGVVPNPARDRVRVRLPREERAELVPPSAEHVETAHALLAPAYRLPLLVLDATGMRVGELEGLTWGDVDEPRGRWPRRLVRSQVRPPRKALETTSFSLLVRGRDRRVQADCKRERPVGRILALRCPPRARVTSFFSGLARVALL